MKPIPIEEAKKIAGLYGYDQIVIIGRSVGDGSDYGEHLTTYGRDKVHCEVAARIGEFLRFKVMGWQNEPDYSQIMATEAVRHAVAFYLAGGEDWREKAIEDIRNLIRFPNQSGGQNAST